MSSRYGTYTTTHKRNLYNTHNHHSHSKIATKTELQQTTMTYIYAIPFTTLHGYTIQYAIIHNTMQYYTIRCTHLQ